MVTALLPEWEPVRSRPQRNAFHRFTVDRHLLETVAQAATRTRRVARPDLLLLGALLHDIGKGRPGDHTEVGIVLAEQICPRLGLDPADSATVVAMVRHHLLLADTAARRDPDDPATVAAVAEAVGDVETLHLLHALAESDSLATGPSMWSPWKAGVLADLVRRTEHVLAGRPAPPPPPPTAAEQELLRADGLRLEVAPGTDDVDAVTLAVADAPGLLSVVAGVLALHRLEVRAVTARAFERRALLSVQVARRYGAPDWSRVRGGPAPRPRRRARRRRPPGRARGRLPPAAGRRCWWRRRACGCSTTWPRPRPWSSCGRTTPPVCCTGPPPRWPPAGSSCASARVSTLGAEAVDAFYVLEADGSRLRDPARQDEVAAAVLAAVSGAGPRGTGLTGPCRRADRPARQGAVPVAARLGPPTDLPACAGTAPPTTRTAQRVRHPLRPARDRLHQAARQGPALRRRHRRDRARDPHRPARGRRRPARWSRRSSPR